MITAIRAFFCERAEISFSVVGSSSWSPEGDRKFLIGEVEEVFETVTFNVDRFLPEDLP